MTEVYDFAAIGAGPAGESAAELAAFDGHRSVVIEKNRPGGTVTTTGGAPTKTLRDRLMPTMDGEMSRRMDDLFRMWGLPVVLSATADTITRTAPRILEVVLSTGAKFQPGTRLFAAGRVATTDGLDLDAAGVKTDSLGRILADEHFRCISPTGTDAPYKFA